MKNIAILSFLLSLFLVACGDNSSSSADDLNEESELSSSSSSKANKSSKSSSSSSVKNKSSSSSSEKVNNSSNSSSSSSSKANKSTKFSSSSSVKNKSSSSSSEKVNNSSNSSSSSSKKANNSSNSSSSSSKKTETVPKDVQNWKDTTEGAIRKGNTTDVIYIFDNKKWRVATLPEASLGGCNEKKENFFGYAEERLEQDLTDPRTNKCTEPYSSYCYHANYHPDFYICQKDYDNKFYWERLDAFGYDYICNDSSYYANNNDIHWGGIDPIKCVNCKQEIFDYFENICKKQCYKGRFTMNVLKCATDFDDCTESLLGTIKEGPTIKSKTEIKDLGEDCYRYHSYVTSIDSTNKTTYICRIRYIEFNYETSYIKPHPSYQWNVASDFDLDAIPTICSWDIDGQIVVGKENTYICEDERLRLATPVEIDAGFACTMYMGDSGNCKGEIISGKNNKYVCDESGFREATQEEIETGIACSSCIINSGLSCNTEMEKEFGKTCTELKSIVEKCRANE